ncbi:DUF47 family protein [Chlamydiia bacterium]|nr:DUF47 family protein [Chlamydiia bacterium]
MRSFFEIFWSPSLHVLSKHHELVTESITILKNGLGNISKEYVKQVYQDVSRKEHFADIVLHEVEDKLYRKETPYRKTLLEIIRRQESIVNDCESIAQMNCLHSSLLKPTIIEPLSHFADQALQVYLNYDKLFTFINEFIKTEFSECEKMIYVFVEDIALSQHNAGVSQQELFHRFLHDDDITAKEFVILKDMLECYGYIAKNTEKIAYSLKRYLQRK